jgi:molybdopterin-biosynthesis enzyme MoeA-like protein
MIAHVLERLPAGAKVLTRSVTCPFGEGEIGTLLAAIQKAHPQTSIGSYPQFDGKRFSTELLVRARDSVILDAAAADVQAMVDGIAAEKDAATKRDLGTGEVA